MKTRTTGITTLLRRCVFCGLLASHGVLAASSSPLVPTMDWLDEVHVGVLSHDVHFAGSVEHGADLNAEVVFKSPFSLPADWASMPLRQLLTPHPAIGFDLNTTGETSQIYLESVWMFSTQLPIRFNVGDLGRHDVFFNVGLGGAINNGKRHSEDPNRKSLGSHVLFHASAEVGIRLTRHSDVSLHFDHSSNAGLSRYNDSLNNAGVRIGWRF